jgi:hypothetical protein
LWPFLNSSTFSPKVAPATCYCFVTLVFCKQDCWLALIGTMCLWLAVQSLRPYNQFKGIMQAV